MACKVHGECASQVCALQSSGRLGERHCLEESAVRYVSSGCARGDGGRSTPWCSIAAALQASGPAVLRLYPGDYPPLVLDPGRTVAIYGSDGSERDQDPLKGTTQVLAQGQPAALTVTGAAPEVILDSLILLGGSHGLKCLGQGTTPRLWWLRGAVQGATGVGILASGCELRVQDTRIHDNQDGALEIRGGTYLIQGSRFFANTSLAQAAVRLSDDTQPLAREPSGGRDDAFLDNCVLGNRNAQGQTAGIDCGSNGRTPLRILRHTLLCANTPLDVNATCAVLAAQPCQGQAACP